MPWTIERQHNAYVVVGPDGTVKGHHSTYSKALRQQRALYANVEEKAANYGAKRGETIAGNLKRGQTGQFESGGGSAAAAAPKPTGKRQRRTRSGRAVAPKKTAEERQAEKKTQLRANQERVGQGAGLGESLHGALLEFSSPDEAIQLSPANAIALEDRGLVEKGQDGQYRMTVAGRSYVEAAKHGDVRRAADAISAGTDRTLGRRSREEARATRRADVEKRRLAREEAKKKPKGGPRLVNAVNKLSSGEDLSDEDMDTLVRNGLARESKTGELVLTAQGMKLVTKAFQLKAVWSTAFVNDLPDGSFLFIESGGKKDEQGKTAPRSLRHFPYKTADGTIDLPHLRNAIARIPQSTAPGLNKAALQARAQKLLAAAQKSTGGVTVYKDSQGRYRWVAVTSNAYRDRDGEIITTKALIDDVAESDHTKLYGPLRWWHVPGVDVGTCDYRAVSGHMLIESGGFNDATLGARIAEKASQLQLSIGFIHPHGEPDAGGVYHQIRVFERSLVPLGRAANPWTRLQVKEQEAMLTVEKEAALRELLGEDADRFLAQVTHTDKSLEAAGVTLKADEPAPDEAPVAEVEAPAEVEPTPEGDGEIYVGDMTPEEFKAILVAAYQEAMAPLMESMGGINVAEKMRGMMDEMKAMTSGYTAKKDDEAAALKASLATTQKQASDLAVRLAALEGEQPRATYRASEDPGTVVSDEARLKDANAQPAADPLDSWISNFIMSPGRAGQ